MFITLLAVCSRARQVLRGSCRAGFAGCPHGAPRKRRRPVLAGPVRNKSSDLSRCPPYAGRT